MVENKLELVKKGDYNNIDLFKMGNGDSIVVEKRYDDVQMKSGEKDYGDGPKKWVMYPASVIYNGEEVSFIIKKSHSTKNVKVEAEEYVKAFDALGGQGTKVKITCTKEMGAAEYDFKPLFKKGDDIIKVDFAFDLAE